MAEEVTEREAALAARVKELEDAQAKSQARTAEGGVFESAWRKIAEIVPPWLAATAVAVLVAHYGFAYYLQGQVTAAETQLKQAKADSETAKAKAANDPDTQGVTMRLATLKAEIDNKRAEAAAAKAKATALNADVNGESAALTAAKVNLNNLQNQARLAEAKAAAESERTGLGTLAEQEAFYKLMKTELHAANVRAGAHMVKDGPSIHWLCVENQFAKDLGCPAQYWPAAPAKPALVASSPSDDNSDDWKPRGQCVDLLASFKRETYPGAFALTKKVRSNGQSGCAGMTASGKSRERLRREALEMCGRQGADCKIISEK